MSNKAPIRVVVFAGGPELEPDVQQFLLAIETHPDIALVAIICESAGQNFTDVAADLWKRRGLLAGPLLIWRQLQLARGWRERQIFKRQAGQLQPRLHFVVDIHNDATLELVRALAPDLGLVYGAPILRPDLFLIPHAGTLGIHHGQVPKYRGKKTLFWAMFNGEKYAGVTIQRLNAGLDSGEIVREGIIEIGQQRYQQVWSQLAALGLKLYVEAILDIRAGTAHFRPQSGPKSRPYTDPVLFEILQFYWRRLKRRY